MFVLQKKNENGWRRFIVKDATLARHGGTTNVWHRAMQFEDEKSADYFRTIHGLVSFDVVESDETDDQEAEAHAWWKAKNEAKEMEERLKRFRE